MTTITATDPYAFIDELFDNRSDVAVEADELIQFLITKNGYEPARAANFLVRFINMGILITNSNGQLGYQPKKAPVRGCFTN